MLKNNRAARREELDVQRETLRFCRSLHRMMDIALATAKSKGFKADPNTALLLIHAEVSEWVEALRKGNPRSDKLGPRFSLGEEEAADAVIRIMHICAALKYNLAAAIIKKMAYNKTRPRKHGKKF